MATKSKPSFEAKQAYCARVRRSNYLASLRLEGFSVERKEVTGELNERTSSEKMPGPKPGVE